MRRKTEIVAENERKFIRENIEEVRKMYEIDLQTLTEICKKFNVKIHNLKEIMGVFNIKIRSNSENKKIVMNRPDVKKNVSEASIKSQSKRNETNLRKYGSEFPGNGINWKDDYEKEHGVRHPNQREESRENMRGDNNPAKRQESRDKMKENRWEKKSQEELDEIWNKTLNTWKENLGVDNPLKSKEIVDKIRQTSMNERGVDWHTKDPKVKEKSLETHQSRMIEKVIERLELLNLELVGEFKNVMTFVDVKCKVCGNIFETILDNVFHGSRICRTCFPITTSINEREIRDFIISILPNEEIIYNDRKILNGKEIDILVPNKKVGIEHNGVYYHSEKMGILKDYHINKTNLSLDEGYELLHIFEDEWSHKKDLVKNKILYKLDNKKLIHQDIIKYNKEISNEEIKNFISKNDLYEYLDYNKCIGVYDIFDELFGLVTFIKIKDSEWRIGNFCVKSDIDPGIINDIIKVFIEDYNVERLIVHTDKRFFDTDIFNDFDIVDEIEPDYSYFKSTLIRISKKEFLSLCRNNNEAEEEFAENNKWSKIWDCGKYVLEYKKQTENI